MNLEEIDEYARIFLVLQNFAEDKIELEEERVS